MLDVKNETLAKVCACGAYSYLIPQQPGPGGVSERLRDRAERRGEAGPGPPGCTTCEVKVPAKTLREG